MIALIVLLLCSSYFNYGIVTTLYVWTIHYFGHIMLHLEHFYTIYSIPHQYHHIRNDWFVYIVNVIAEFSMMTIGILLPKYIFPVSFSFLNETSVFFNYIIYTTVHYLNYTYLRVNQYHVKHHIVQNTNYYPDLFDKIFKTYHPETTAHEDITHMIPNIIFAFLVVNTVKPSQYWLFVAWISTGIFLLLSSIYFLKVRVVYAIASNDNMSRQT
jgi:hypothetical protein